MRPGERIEIAVGGTCPGAGARTRGCPVAMSRSWLLTAAADCGGRAADTVGGVLRERTRVAVVAEAQGVEVEELAPSVAPPWPLC